MTPDVPEQLSAFLKLMSYYISVGLIGSARWQGFFFVFPFFRWVRLPGTIAMSTAVAMSFPIWPAVIDAAAGRYLPIYPLVSAASNVDLGFARYGGVLMLTLKEFAVGVMLGLVPAMFFYGVLFTGELIDSSRGDTNAAAAGDDLQMTNTGLILFLAAGMLFFGSGAFFRLMLLLYDSYERIPIADPAGIFGLHNAVGVVVSAFGMLLQSVIGVWPIVVVMLSFDVLTIVQSKVDKKFQGADLVPVMRNLLFFIVMWLYLGYMEGSGGGSALMLSIFAKIVS